MNKKLLALPISIILIIILIFIPFPVRVYSAEIPLPPITPPSSANQFSIIPNDINFELKNFTYSEGMRVVDVEYGKVLITSDDDSNTINYDINFKNVRVYEKYPESIPVNSSIIDQPYHETTYSSAN